MQYAVEDVSPVKRKVSVTVPAEEVNASLGATLAMYRTNVSLDGFRKGKVPAQIVENRFRKEVYRESTTDLVNVHINQIIGELKAEPISGIQYDGAELERDKEFAYSFSFEVLPEFELPAYEGFEVEEELPEVNEAEVDAVLERVRGNMATYSKVEEDRLPVDGDLVNIDFSAFDDEGKPVPGIKAENMQMPLGDRQALEDFEALVKTVRVGEEKEGKITFPEDFVNPDFVGKTLTMKVKLHSIEQRNLPELDAEFAKKAGNFESLEKMRETVRESYMKTRADLCRSSGQQRMLESLLKMVEFPVPESMVRAFQTNILADLQSRLQRQGKSLTSIGKNMDELKAESAKEAENFARVQVFLLSAAKKEGLSVNEFEVDAQIREMAAKSGQDFNALKAQYQERDMIFALRDRLLADKAMNAIYDKARIAKVPAGHFSKLEERGEAAAPAKAEAVPDEGN